MNEALELFLMLLKASSLAVGGQAALPLLRQELVAPGIITDAQVVESLTIGRLTPGPSGSYVVSMGYFALGWLGAAVALVAVTLPPLVVVPAAALLRRQMLSAWFAGVVRGVTMTTSGLVITTTLVLMFPGGATLLWWQLLLVALGTFVTLEGRRHPALAVGAGAIAGLVLSR